MCILDVLSTLKTPSGSIVYIHTNYSVYYVRNQLFKIQDKDDKKPPPLVSLPS